jgi:HNH endonuclease
LTQSELILSYFENNPNRDIPHKEVVDWVTAEYIKRTGVPLRDPDRAIRKLGQEGKLIKIAKGVYRYDPDFTINRDLEDFTAADKKIILERDGYKCVICGRGKEHGVELHVDHIKAKDLGGKATLENGQTLCAQHNFLKKNYKQTETGKKMFISLLRYAKSIDDTKTIDFCEAILKTFDKFNVNGHIEWKDTK